MAGTVVKLPPYMSETDNIKWTLPSLTMLRFNFMYAIRIFCQKAHMTCTRLPFFMAHYQLICGRFKSKWLE